MAVDELERSKALMAARIRSFHQKLARWYAQHGRGDLPWRNTRDAYAIYLSETMLQQTQVKTVLERFYTPFLTQFPTLASLANAEQDDVLRAWQGLGYYSRARNLHKAAKACKGALPKTVEGLLALPGIGKNTAHAVAAFAHHAPVPVMEANVKRVLCRIFALETPGDNELWERAHQLLDKADPFNYNQAMMDIGATICTRRAPDCPACPANEMCQGKTAPENYPAPKAKKVEKIRKKRIFVLINDKGQIHTTARTTRFLGGLYHFTEFDVEASLLSSRRRPGSTSGQTPLGGWIPACAGMTHLGDVRQVYSHFTLEAEVYLCTHDIPKQILYDEKNWYGANQLASLPFSGAEQKILALLRGAGAAKA